MTQLLDEVGVQPALAVPVGALAVLALVSVAAERLEIHLETRSDSLTLSFSEVAFVLALFTLPPALAVTARVVGGLAAIVLRRGPRSWSKTAFNAALFSAETALGTLLVSVLAEGHGVTDVRAWVAVLAATTVMITLDAVALSIVIALHTGGAERPPLMRTLPVGIAASLGVTCLGLAMALFLAVEPIALALLVPPVVLLFLSSRSYLRLAERHEVLERLHDYSSQVAASTSLDDSVAAALRDAAAITRAEDSEVLLLDADGRPEQWLRVVGADGTVRPAGRPVDGAADPIVARILAGDSDGVSDEDAVAVPLDVGDRRIGVITVRNRQGDVTGFEPTDATVLGAIANHAAVAIENARLIDRLRAEADERERLARQDALTGLANRRGFHADLTVALDRLTRTHRPFALVMVDLARFKDVNDTFGHGAGDRVIHTIADRLQGILRPLDACARLGGDEFAALVDGAGPDEALEFARRLLHQIERPVLHDGVPVVVSATIGIACAPLHGEDQRTLLHHADVALYSAKESGRAVVVFDDDEERATTRRHRLALELRRALEREDQLRLVYQPKAKLADGRVSSVEALLRWNHPELGAVPPDEFVRIAEQMGMIHQLTGSVLEMGIAQAGLWQRQGVELGMSLNVSVANLADETLPGRIGSLLRRHDVDPGRITVEVTETAIMRDANRTTEVLADLDRRGLRLSIDDFGTGYSSLAYLKRIPVRELKIDKCFVTDLEHSPSDLVIARSVIGLATNLGLSCVAEGVETVGTWDILAELGCTEAQGYYLARPMAAADLEAFVRSRRADRPEPGGSAQ